jgi:hypothetical protein
MKNAVFLDVAPCGSCQADDLVKPIGSIFWVEIIGELRIMSAVSSSVTADKQQTSLLVTADTVPILLISPP